MCIRYFRNQSMNMTTEAVILGNGDYPSHPYPLNVLRQAPYVVCCDGAADEYIRHGFLPDAIIGDGDSLSSENREKLATIFHQIKDQETNDQTKAVRFLTRKTANSHHRRHRQTGRSYIGEYQPADGLHAGRTASTNDNGLRRIHPIL